MEHRRLGRSGLVVPALSFGAGTFGGRGPLFGAWGTTDVAQAREIVDICLEAGITMFDTADVYSDGASEEVLGAALEGRRDEVLISTKAGLPIGDGPWQAGTSRSRLITAVDAALRRLRTDRIDLFQLHAYDAGTPAEEVLATLDALVDAGKVRYVGVSNYSGWQLMQALERGGPQRLAPLRRPPGVLLARRPGLRVGPHAAGCGRGRRRTRVEPTRLGPAHGSDPPREPRCRRAAGCTRPPRFGPPVDDELLFDVVDVLDELALETGRTVPQIALNWLLTRPTVASVIIGARDAAQLRQNLGALGWRLTDDQIARMDAVSMPPVPYPHFPYRRQEGFARVNPPLAG